MDDVTEFMEGVAGELVNNILEDIVFEMAREIACDVCFEEDAADVWMYRRRGTA